MVCQCVVVVGRCLPKDLRLISPFSSARQLPSLQCLMSGMANVRTSKKRVLTAEFSHETNTFATNPTTLSDFTRHCYCDSPEGIYQKHYGMKTGIGSTFELGEKYDWEVIPAVAAIANPSGKIQDDCFEFILSKILQKALDPLTPIDGVLLHLHGAMVTVTYEDAEGEILLRLRQHLGVHIPILVTLDLHGNITDKMIQNSTLLIAVRTYPHIDFYERGIQAGNLLQRYFLNEIQPLTVICKVPIIGGCDGGRTQIGPMVELISRGNKIELENEALVVSICSGFTASDIFEIGPSVTVTVNEFQYSSHEEALNYAQALANSFGEYIWNTKEFCSLDILTIEQVTLLAQVNEQEDKREGRLIASSTSSSSSSSSHALIIADVSDNPGSGHYGDSTDLLLSLIHCQLKQPAVFFAIYDPEAVRQGQLIGQGKEGTITLGGRCAPHLGGGPLTLTGVVSFLGDSPELNVPMVGPMAVHVHPTGPCMRFTVQKNFDICVQSNNGQPYDIGQLTAFG
jgi:microcystin degradation protein MlrC